MQRLVDGQTQLIQLERLREEVGDAALNRLLEVFHRGKAGHDNDRDRRVALARDVSEIQAAHRGHLDVGQQQIEALAAA